MHQVGVCCAPQSQPRLAPAKQMMTTRMFPKDYGHFLSKFTVMSHGKQQPCVLCFCLISSGNRWLRVGKPMMHMQRARRGSGLPLATLFLPLFNGPCLFDRRHCHRPFSAWEVASVAEPGTSLSQQRQVCALSL